jgi:hypothetical protein
MITFIIGFACGYAFLKYRGTLLEKLVAMFK